MAAKKKAKKTGLHAEVNHIWGWVVMAIGIFTIFAIAGYYYLSFQVV